MKRNLDKVEVLLTDTIGPNEDVVTAGLAWLIQNGGGCVVTHDRRSMENALRHLKTTSFDRLTRELADSGITLSWYRRGLPHGDENILALYIDTRVDEVVQRGSVQHILIMPWTEYDATWFKCAYRPTIVSANKGEALRVVDPQPDFATFGQYIPDDRDKVLGYLATMAAGYDNWLDPREKEYFKADLMKHRLEWITMEPDHVLFRCAELGMSADDSREISDMVKQLREGHRFRVKHRG